MPQPPTPTNDNALPNRALEAAIQIGVILLLVTWCFQIVRPFITPMVWGIQLGTLVQKVLAAFVGPGRVHLCLARAVLKPRERSIT